MDIYESKALTPEKVQEITGRIVREVEEESRQTHMTNRLMITRAVNMAMNEVLEQKPNEVSSNGNGHVSQAPQEDYPQLNLQGVNNGSSE